MLYFIFLIKIEFVSVEKIFFCHGTRVYNIRPSLESPFDKLRRLAFNRASHAPHCCRTTVKSPQNPSRSKDRWRRKRLAKVLYKFALVDPF